MPFSSRGFLFRLVLTAGLIASSAVPTSAEVIFSFKADSPSAREIVRFAAPTGWHRNDKAGQVKFVASKEHAECSISFGYRIRGESDAYFERATLISSASGLRS
jgi:hypothetical protein